MAGRIVRGFWFAFVLLVAGCDSGPGGGTMCTPASDGCAGETICISGRCEGAFGRFYSITDVSVSVPTTDETGATWDALGGAPDPFITVAVDGTAVATSTTTNDTFSTFFFGPYDALLLGGSSLTIEVWDEDVTANDLMFTCRAAAVPANLLRARSLSCVGGGFSVSFQIDPR